jgi:segregation and condensation protein B
VDPLLRPGLEALLFLADEPVPTPELAASLDVGEDVVDDACQQLADEYRLAGRGVAVRRSGGGWRMYTAEAAWPVVERHVLSGRTGRLSSAALETLAVIAYKQPITRSAIGEVRGVNPDGAVRSLVARGYVEEVGRADAPGQPVLYGTTARLLEELGLDELDELPDLADHLPEDDAPDEPADLRAARRLLAGGGRLPSTGADRWVPDPADDLPDDAQDAGPPSQVVPADGGLGPPDPRAGAARGDDELDELTSRVEAAARSAMDQLRDAVAATERDAAEDGADSGDEADSGDGVEDDVVGGGDSS